MLEIANNNNLIKIKNAYQFLIIIFLFNAHCVTNVFLLKLKCPLLTKYVKYIVLPIGRKYSNYGPDLSDMHL